MMTIPTSARRTRPLAPAGVPGARQTYLQLRQAPAPALAADFLRRQLAEAGRRPCFLPTEPGALADWLNARHRYLAAEYREQRALRDEGGPRRHFGTRPDARRFLQQAAPTLLAQGAWLHGLVAHWDIAELQPLLNIYLAYLGHGVPEANRVLQVKQALTVQGCNNWQEQEDEYFVQGAIALALACCGPAMLPELLGYQLGMTELPIYQPLVLDELKELGVAHLLPAPETDHAVMTSLYGLLVEVHDRPDFLRRITLGYRLARVGVQVLEDAVECGVSAATAAATVALAPLTMQPILANANRPVEHAPRGVIRHAFPPDEHAWEGIVNELGLLEAQVASCISKDDAMALLGRHMAPGQHHQPTGLMACRIFNQLYATS
jgi:hypothetical protein